MKQMTMLLVLFLVTTFTQAQTPDSAKSKKKVYEITSLSKKADSDKYGLTAELPVKVGSGSKGGPANQRAYLDLLRDAQGNKIEYYRMGSCCEYKSENGFMGYALLDKYSVTFKDKDGNTKKTIIFISFYDYEEPMIPVGFQSANSN